MSNSYKSEPVIKDYNRGSKKFANRRVRRKLKNASYKYISNGNSYKKLSCSYDICDYSFRMTWQDFLISLEELRNEKFSYHSNINNLEDARNWWERYYFRK